MFALNGERSGKTQPANKRYGGSKITEAFSALTATAFRPAVTARCVRTPLAANPHIAGCRLKSMGFTLAIENAVGKREAVVGLDKRRLDSHDAHTAGTLFSETGRGIGRRRRSKNADERIYHH